MNKKEEEPPEISRYIESMSQIPIVLLVSLAIILMMYIQLLTSIQKGDRRVREETFRSNIISGNFLLPIAPVSIAKGEINSIIMTGYSSTVEQCDDTPFITASGERVREGIVANNCLPFGTIIETEEGEMLEVVDRMNKRYTCEYFDKWFPTTEEAIQHGVKEYKIKVYQTK